MDLERFSEPGTVSKLVQPFAINVPWKMWTALWEDGHVSWWMPERFDEQFAVLDSSDLHDPDAGLNLSGETGGVTGALLPLIGLDATTLQLTHVIRQGS